MMPPKFYITHFVPGKSNPRSDSRLNVTNEDPRSAVNVIRPPDDPVLVFAAECPMIAAFVDVQGKVAVKTEGCSIN
jgi:hypothetical protein